MLIGKTRRRPRMTSKTSSTQSLLLQPRTGLSLDTAIPVAGHEASVVRHAWGPCGLLCRNFPFLLCGWGIALAMAAGNTCVVKPAEDTPLSTLYVALGQEIGIPDGVINVIPGVGEVTGAALSGIRTLPHVFHRLARSRPHGGTRLRS